MVHGEITPCPRLRGKNLQGRRPDPDLLDGDNGRLATTGSRTAFRQQSETGLLSQMTTIFLHIPKTAGSSLRTLFTLNYSASEVASIYGDVSGIRDACSKLTGKTSAFKLIQGHIPYGTHFNLGLKSAAYFFFLRHPVDRHFSDAGYGARTPEHGFHGVLSAVGAGPATWATIADSAIYFRNTATHYLSGVFFAKDVDLSDFHRAAEVVVKSEFVGLAERFEESVLMMARKLHWSNVIYEKRNVSPVSGRHLATAQERNTCAARLGFDLALYQIGCERFEHDARRHGVHLQEAAHQLRELVAVQTTAFPDLENREYLVGDTVPTYEALSRKVPVDSPLALWLRARQREGLSATLFQLMKASREKFQRIHRWHSGSGPSIRG